VISCGIEGIDELVSTDFRISSRACRPCDANLPLQDQDVPIIFVPHGTSAAGCCRLPIFPDNNNLILGSGQGPIASSCLTCPLFSCARHLQPSVCCHLLDKNSRLSGFRVKDKGYLLNGLLPSIHRVRTADEATG
jgi:hypothetical protein